MGSIHDELDASVGIGTGFICVVGPPSGGKTTLVLDYLVGRERSFTCSSPRADDPARAMEEVSQPEFLMDYFTARSMTGNALSHLTERVRHAASPTRRRRLPGYDCSPLDFANAVAEWTSARPSGSELHLVLDDADMLQEDCERVSAWMSGVVQLPATASSVVCLWLVSQLPLKIADCFRFHFVSAASTDMICEWLQAQFLEHGEDVFSEGLCGGGGGSEWSPDVSEVTLSPQSTHDCVLQAVRYYSTHQPMQSTVVSRDVRELLKRVYDLLPTLLELGKVTVLDAPSSAAIGGHPCDVKLNAVDLSRAWGRYREDGRRGAGGERGGAAAEPLVCALQRIGYSAVLLAFAAFYCGAVPRSKQAQVFGATGGVLAPQRKTEANAQSHRASVLSASVHLITGPRLMFLYEAVLQMCAEHIDPLEFAPPPVAAQHIHEFVSWGLLTPALSASTTSYHCWIPVNAAVHLGKVLSINLYDLIPM